MILKPLKAMHKSAQSGFTIIESLVAIIVVTILLTAISPVLVLAVANRVQAKRVDIATSAAKSYIDGLRSGAINEHPPITSAIVSAPGNAINCSNLDSVTPAITPAIGYCSTPTIGGDYRLFCIDGDGNGVCADDPKDMVIQAYGYQATPTPGKSNDELANEGYGLRIRVYRSDAFDGRELVAGEPQAAFTGGLGLKPQEAPLFETATQIVTDQTTYEDLCNVLDGCN